MGVLPDLCDQCQGLTYGRNAGRPICATCMFKARVDQEAAAPAMRCPVDGNEMVKEVIAGAIIIDRCLSCRGVWLQADELALVSRASASGSNFVSGVFLGMALG